MKLPTSFRASICSTLTASSHGFRLTTRVQYVGLSCPLMTLIMKHQREVEGTCDVNEEPYYYCVTVLQLYVFFTLMVAIGIDVMVSS